MADAVIQSLEGIQRNSFNYIYILELVDFLKGYANFINPDQKDGSNPKYLWGKMTNNVPVMPEDQSSPRVVYFEGNTKLTSTQGTGILLVKGALELSGGLAWYGIVITTGSMRFTENGDMNITGGVISSSGATIDETQINGGAKIYYCSSA